VSLKLSRKAKSSKSSAVLLPI